MGTQNQRYESIRDIEKARYDNQLIIDAQKNIEDRRRLGQFSTPYELAKEIACYSLNLINRKDIKFLEPAFGTGVFYSALSELTNGSDAIISCDAYEIDCDYFNIAKQIWENENIDIQNQDFLSIREPEQKYNLLITNPPYVRHHYIDKRKKEELKKAVLKDLGIKISGLSGLYCYFMLLAHKWLEKDAVCGWLIPSEFMDVNYGTALKEYLLDKVHLIRIHRYNPSNCQFDDALVSSCVVWFRNESIKEDYDIVFSYGGTHDHPEKECVIKKSFAKQATKWTHIVNGNYEKEAEKIQTEDPVIGNYFEIKRGLATGDNDFFILSKEQIIGNDLDMRFFKPILPSPRNMKCDEVLADDEGNPKIEQQLFLLDCDLSEEEIERDYPSLWEYLSRGLSSTANKYLCRSRKKWYFQEKRKPTAFLCSYMGRGKENGMPFRFILNHSNAIASNSYLLLYPKENLVNLLKDDDYSYNKIWDALQSISVDDMESEGRVYGGGLKKIEPKELAKVKCRNLQYVLS